MAIIILYLPPPLHTYKWIHSREVCISGLDDMKIILFSLTWTAGAMAERVHLHPVIFYNGCIALVLFWISELGRGFHKQKKMLKP